MKKVMGGVCLFVLGMLCLWGASGCVQAQDAFSGSLVGKRAPDIRLEKLSGGSQSLQEVMAGKNAIMVFWATWCPHCREQLAAVQAKRTLLERKNIAIVLVNIGEGRAQVQRFMQAKGYDLDVFLDADSRAAEMYQVLGIPMIVLVGSDGNILDVGYGVPENIEEILK